MSASSYTNVAEALYVAYFGRPADVNGLGGMAAQLSSADTSHTGTTIAGLAAEAPNVPALNALVNSFGNSAESQALYGSGSTTNFVNAIYGNLFDRAPDASGLNFWVNAINTGQVTKGEAALQIMSAALQNTTAQGIIDAATVNDKILAATDYVNTMAADPTGDDVASYVGASAAVTARGLLATVNVNTSVSSPAFQTGIALTIQNVDIQNNLTHVYTANQTAHTAGSYQFNLHTGATFDGMPELSIFNGLLVGDIFSFTENQFVDYPRRSVVNVTAAEAASAAALHGQVTPTLADWFTAAIEVAAPPRQIATFTYGGNTYIFEEQLAGSIQNGSLVEIPGIHTIGYNLGSNGGWFHIAS